MTIPSHSAVYAIREGHVAMNTHSVYFNNISLPYVQPWLQRFRPRYSLGRLHSNL